MTKQNQLPEAFLASMKELLKEEYEDYLKCFENPRYYGLRINHLKISNEQFEKLSPFSVSRVPWSSNGYYYNEEEQPAKHPYYYAGLYYLQEPSAMAPAQLLPVKPGDQVLDLCAAPGGKSTELGAKLKGKGMLLSNDISYSRCQALLKNLELSGISNFCVTSETPAKLSQAYPEAFDAILVDAPCSGEGMFRKDADMVKDWLVNGPAHYCVIQKEILQDAVKMLKPGGYLLYSTCTFDLSEDEFQIKELLKNHEELELVMLPAEHGLVSGYDLDGAVRLFPHKIKGEGHFLALLHKRETHSSVSESMLYDNHKVKLENYEELSHFLKKIKRELDLDRLCIIEDKVYYLPENFYKAKGVRYLRTGLLLGELKKKRFEPSQALAMTLTPETFETCLNLSQNDDRVIRYLKGETIALREEEEAIKGWCLVCVDGFALGFAKGTGMMLKNKYYPGWRWQ